MGRLRSWMLPPQSDDPVERLRYARRMMRHFAVLIALAGAVQLGLGQTTIAVVFFVAAVGNLLGFVSLKRAIDRVSEAPPPTDEQRRRGRRRARRYFAVMVPAVVVVGAAIGWAINGLPAAIFMAAFISLGMGFAVWRSREQLRD